jgi:hypothetical protein
VYGEPVPEIDHKTFPPSEGAVTLYVIETFVGLVLVALIDTVGAETGGVYW